MSNKDRGVRKMVTMVRGALKTPHVNKASEALAKGEHKGRRRSRRARRQTLLQLVMTQQFQTQEALQMALRARGFSVTQSSISRDIRALGLQKRDGVYVAPHELLAGPGGLEVWQAVEEVRLAGPHMLIVRCHPAMAAVIGGIIDDSQWPGVAGTVAGDDTLLIALSEASVQNNLQQRINTLANLTPSSPL